MELGSWVGVRGRGLFWGLLLDHAAPGSSRASRNMLTNLIPKIRCHGWTCKSSGLPERPVIKRCRSQSMMGTLVRNSIAYAA